MLPVRPPSLGQEAERLDGQNRPMRAGPWAVRPSGRSERERDLASAGAVGLVGGCAGRCPVHPWLKLWVEKEPLSWPPGGVVVCVGSVLVG